jgi:hypothetical protein
LQIEKLEDRYLLAGNLPWPIIPPAGQSQSLYDTYGQFVAAGGLHFHEGIDIIAAPGTPVLAVEKGVIRFAPFAPPAAGAGGANQWVVELSGTHGWNYVHTIPGINRRTGVTWAAGDQVNPGDQLGVVAAFGAAPFPNHLHLDYTSDAVDPAFGNLLTPAGDPLDYLRALPDTTKPTLSNDKIHFRLASDETSASPSYFTDTMAGRTILGAQAQASGINGSVAAGSPNIDITADIYDQLQPGGNRLGVKSVWFSLTGMTWGDQSGNINPYRFSGSFLAGQNYTTLRNVGLVRTVYATDAYSQSATDQDFWYNLTNSTVTAATVGQPSINVADRDLYWKSDVAAGNAWNATTAPSAANNAGAAFRDDYYTVDVWAFDASGNMGEAKTTVLLDNFVRTISTSAPEYSTIQPIIVSTGTQYTANQQVPIYFLTAPPRDGQALARADLEGTATTNNNGVLQMTNLDSAVHRGLVEGTYYVVADYLKDGTYNAKLDAYTTIQIVPQLTGAPTVTRVTPNQGANGGGTRVTITGTGFTGATRVQFGSNNATGVTVVSDTEITATAPAGQPGAKVDVTVTTPKGTSAANSADQFTYQNTAPTVTSIAPNQGSRFGGTPVTITGTGFTGATRVQFGITPASSFTVVSNTRIVATSPQGDPGTVDVRVITPWGTSPIVAADQYTFQTNAPTVTAVAPAQGSRFGGYTVTITGTGFFTATDVRFGTNAATAFTIVNGTTITATVPPGTPGTVDVRVTTPAGQSATVAADRFTYQRTPAVTFVSPNGGLPAGGNVVIITGSHFVAASRVNFGAVAVPAADVTFVNAHTLRVKVPALPAGTQPPATVHVTVTTPAGTSPTSIADQYTYAVAPAVTAVAPKQGLPAGGNTVTITGTNFTGATAVRFGAVPVPADATFTVDSPTQITVTAPAQAAGVVDITVTTPSGTSPVVAADRYTYAPAPAVTALNPNQGPTNGGTAVIITGTAFTNVTAVKFGSLAATNFTVNSATQITATAPAQAAGVVDVAVTTPSGTSPAVAADNFTYVAPPSIISIVPNHGPAAGGTSVTISGSNFTGTYSVSFGNSLATSYSVDSDAVITATSPAHFPGMVDITVTTPSGTSQLVLADQFTFDAANATATQLSSSVNPSLFGQAVTFTATVSAAAGGTGAPTGMVTFMDGTTPLGTGTLSVVAGVDRATWSTAALIVGSHSITANYVGSGNFGASISAPLTQVVNKASTSTAVVSSIGSAVYGQSVAFTATVSAMSPGSGTPTGTVQFQVDGNNIGTPVALTAGTATSVSLSTLAAGSHTVRATYSGDGSFLTSTGTNAQNVTPAPLTITANNQSKVYGAALPSLTASYSGFVNGDTAASLTTPPTLMTTAMASSPVGSYPITASGAVDSNYSIAYVAGTLTVNQAGTVTGIGANHPTSVFGEPIYFAAAVVAVAPGAGTPTGTVAFERLFPNGTTVIFGTAPLDASGTAVFVMDHFVPATATVFAVYLGDANFSASTSTTISHVINPASTTLTVSSSTPTSVAGQPVNFTSTLGVVAPGSFVVPPTGTITFYDMFQGNTSVLSTIVLGGPPGSSPAFTAVGTHIITAVYSGDSNFNGSTSAPITQIVTASAATHFSLSAATGSTAGQAVPVIVTALDAYNNPVAGYSGTVHFTSSDGQAGLPADYTFMPSDNGSHPFNSTLKTAGAQTLTAYDLANPGVGGSATIQVVAAAATHLQLVAAQNTIYPNVPFAMIVTALDAYGNVAISYRGTIHFTSSDAQASVPADVTFTAAANGVLTVSGFVLRSPADQTFTATDTVTATITGVAYFIFQSA